MRQRNTATDQADSEFRWIEVDLADILFLIRKHFFLLLLLPLGFAIVAMFACFSMRPVFASNAVLYLRPNFDKEMLIERSFSKLEDGDSLRSIEKAIVSDTVILRMIDKLGLREDKSFVGEIPKPGSAFSDDAILKKVRKRYQTKLLPNTRLVKLEVGDFSPERSKLITETLIDEFLRYLGEERDVQKNELRLTLVKQAEDALQEALTSEKQLEEFRSGNPDLIVEQDSSIFQDRLLQYSQSLNEASSEKSILEGNVAALEGIDPLEDPYRIFQILKNRNSEYLSELLGMHASAKADFASIGQQFTKGHPSYREAESRLEQVESTIRTYAEEMKDGLESEYQAASRREEKLQESLGNLQTQFVAFKSKSASFRGLKEQIDRNWNTYTKLQEKITDLDLNPENEFNFVTLVSKPIVPDKKSKPITKLWMAGAGFFGLLCVAGALLFRYRDGLPYTTLSQISGERSISQASLVTISKKQTPESLATAPEILNLAIGTGANEILHVTSPAGDPQAAIFIDALAKALRSDQLRTLVVRLDFEEGPDENKILESPVPGVSHLTLSARRLLDPEAFQSGLRQCLQSFDRILVNTSHFTHWESILATASHADTTLVLTRKKTLSRLLYQRFFELLEESTSAGPSAVVLEGSFSKPGRKQGHVRLPLQKSNAFSAQLWKRALHSPATTSTGNA